MAKYNTPEERASYLQKRHNDYIKHKEKRLAYQKEYDSKHSEERREYKRKYNRKYDRKYKWDGQHKRNWTCRKYTSEEMRLMYERADHVARNYRHIDAQKGFDVSETITGDWIVENIFYKECLYCGCRDYTVLGADRIDNRKPHSANNVVPCCKDCNNKRHTKDFMEFFGMSFMENFILED